MQSDPHQVLNIKGKQAEQTTSRVGSDSMMARLKNYSLDGLDRNVLRLFPDSPRFSWWFAFALVFHWSCLTSLGSPNVSTRCSVESSSLLH